MVGLCLVSGEASGQWQRIAEPNFWVPADAGGRLVLTSTDSQTTLEYACDRLPLRGQNVYVLMGSRIGFGARGGSLGNINFDVKFVGRAPDDWNMRLFDQTSVVFSSIFSGVGGASAGVQNSYGEVQNPVGWTQNLLQSAGGIASLRYAVPGGRWLYQEFKVPDDTREVLTALYTSCGKPVP